MENQKLMKIVAVSVLFFIIASPCTYCLVNSLTGLVLDKKGCPTYLGVLIHSVVFGLLLYAMCSLMENKENFIIECLCPDGKSKSSDCCHDFGP